MKYVPCHRQLFLSLAVWDATRVRVCLCVCVFAYVCACACVCDMPGLMSSGVINRTVKWPRVLPSALLPPLQTLELVELIASRPIVGLQEFSCVGMRFRTNMSSRKQRLKMFENIHFQADVSQN